MSQLGLETADLVYRFSRKLSIKKEKIEWPELSDFCSILLKLKRQLGDTVQDEYWKAGLRPFKTYEFILRSTPLRSNHPSICSEDDMQLLRSHFRHCETLYPGSGSLLADLFSSQNALVSEKRNPLLELIRSYAETHTNPKTAVLIKESRYITIIEETLKEEGLEMVAVVSPAQLRGNETFKRILVVGPSRWFPEYVFCSPRSASIRVFTHTFVSDSWSPSRAFVGSSVDSLRSNNARPVVAPGYDAPATSEIGMTLDELMPQIDWIDISRLGQSTRAENHEGPHNTLDEEVPARLLMLEGNQAVFLEAFETSRALLIDLESDEEMEGAQNSQGAVKKMPTSKIGPGLFLLLRTIGGGDYIVPIADKILGKRASYARALQSRWKELLAASVRRLGFSGTCEALTRLGATLANETNLRNWISRRLIRPWKDEDFLAILKLVSLENERTEYFEIARKIHSAHQSAGHKIKLLLVQEVMNSDLSVLRRLGRMEFELQGAGSGSLTASRILSIAPNTFNVLSSKTGVPFEVSSKLGGGAPG